MRAEVIERAARPGHSEAQAFFGAVARGGYSVHSSKAMMMSAPRAICTSMECSGVKKCELPSRWERNWTPSSVTLRSELRRKDLEAAGVREQGARPTHEFVQAAHAADGFVAGAEIEMVCVAENDFRAERFERVLRDGFDGALRADGHEDGGFDGLVRQKESRRGGRRRGIPPESGIRGSPENSIGMIESEGHGKLAIWRWSRSE